MNQKQTSTIYERLDSIVASISLDPDSCPYAMLAEIRYFESTTSITADDISRWQVRRWIGYIRTARLCEQLT